MFTKTSASHPHDERSHDTFRDRRRSEMKRRFLLLQARRSNLERELDSIKLSLISLDKQMKHYAAYEQLTIG
ncbi:hypothetical protein [Prochlorococcus sp. MIT 1341]|uniref:hypothetical protein n=1 Tax=Prochlorococcus sp. MIT 1341 TaxID=3096221 RepID=UPI002A764785|nr:hypothetical protein [Prochlorococcus sp. MIT 1341]